MIQEMNVNTIENITVVKISSFYNWSHIFVPFRLELHVNSVEFFCNCTKLAMLSILYYFVVKGKLISAKKFALSGIRTPVP